MPPGPVKQCGVGVVEVPEVVTPAPAEAQLVVGAAQVLEVPRSLW